MVEQAQRGFETRDANVRMVVSFALILVVAGTVIYFVCAGLYKFFEHRYPSPDPPSRIAFDPGMVAPEPRLQTNPPEDFSKFAKAESTKLNSYGWVDRDRGVIRIPIERAMDLIAQRGLPTRGPGTKNSSGVTPEQMQQEKAAATAPKP